MNRPLLAPDPLPDQSRDRALARFIIATLTRDPSILADQVAVSVCDGVVTLAGFIPSYCQKRAAEAAVAGLPEVYALLTDLTVRLPEADRRSDLAIALAAHERLDGDSSIPAGAVLARVRAGVVTLLGAVAHRYQRDAAERAILPLWGVVDLCNQVTVLWPQRPAPAQPLFSAHA